MPIPIPILSEGINAASQLITNIGNRRFAREQYKTARRDALSDYAMQNEYNSPAAQMERLKQAGLNPNLVYGTGAGSMTAAPIKSAPQNSAQSEAPKVDLGGAVGKYLNAENMKLQSDNLRAQNTVLLEQAKNIAQDTLNKSIGYDDKEFGLDWKKDTRNLNEWRLQESNKNIRLQGNKIQAETANTLARTQSEIALRNPRVANLLQNTSESVQRVISMRLQMAKTTEEINQIVQSISNAKKTGALQDLEIMLKQKGVSWSDPAWQRKAIMLLENLIN